MMKRFLLAIAFLSILFLFYVSFYPVRTGNSIVIPEYSSKIAQPPLTKLSDAEFEDLTSLLQKIIQVPSIRARENEVATILKFYLNKYHLPFREFQHPERKDKVALIAEIGPKDSKEGIILMGHMDVVEVEKESWKSDPFRGEIQEGRIVGRGALDMKGLLASHLIAFQKLAQNAASLKHKVMFLAVPDEESGGIFGAKWLAATRPDLFQGYETVWNEGGYGFSNFLGKGKNYFGVQVAEKGLLWVNLEFEGEPGHGSMPKKEHTTQRFIHFVEKLEKEFNSIVVTAPTAAMFASIAEVFDFPQSFFIRRIENPVLQPLIVGGVSSQPSVYSMIRNTISYTKIETSGPGKNVIPGHVLVNLDMRLLPGLTHEVALRKIEELGREFDFKVTPTEASTATESPIATRFLSVLKHSIVQKFPNSVVSPIISPAATDNRFMRALGLKAYGLQPYLITSKDLETVHGNNENLSLENLRQAPEVIVDTVRLFNLE